MYSILGASAWQQTTDEVLTNYKVITNLEKGTYYDVRVVAYDGFNRMRSEVQSVGTNGFGKLYHLYYCIATCCKKSPGKLNLWISKLTFLKNYCL